MLVPNIYFDESGNTGSNLLDPNQPVFSLASCSFQIMMPETLSDYSTPAHHWRLILKILSAEKMDKMQ